MWECVCNGDAAGVKWAAWRRPDDWYPPTPTPSQHYLTCCSLCTVLQPSSVHLIAHRLTAFPAAELSVCVRIWVAWVARQTPWCIERGGGYTEAHIEREGGLHSVVRRRPMVESWPPIDCLPRLPSTQPTQWWDHTHHAFTWTS